MCECTQNRLVDLGFAKTKLPPGTHICQIYSDEKERDDSLKAYLTRGVQLGECNACFSENITKEQLAAHMANMGVDLEKSTQSGALLLSGSREVYFEGNRFDPNRMLALLTQFHKKSTTDGYTGARVIGEMHPDIATIEGGSRLIEYESRVSVLLRTHPITTVCQYDARVFDGATILNVLKVHPMMVVRGTVIENPFFVQPEEILGQT